MVKTPILVPPRMKAAARLTSAETIHLAMKCPICKETDLIEKPIGEGLTASSCTRCHGLWIDAPNYWKWLETRPEKREPVPADKQVDLSTQRPVNDSGPGKFCPRCGRFLARAKPGHGLGFFINRCGGCGGIWLDANEWENLVDAKLHDQIHFIFSDSWQAELTRIERDRQHEQLLAEKIGRDALAEIKRIKAWIEQHPKRAELYAFLVGPKESGPSKR